MIKNTAKAEGLIRDLKDKLAVRLAADAPLANRLDTVRDARDSEGFPYLMLSNAANEAAGQPVILIRVKQQDAISKDILGNAMNAYSPHVSEIAYEAGVTTLDRKDIALVMFELAPAGIKLQIKEIANGTAVTAANADAAAVAQEFDCLYWPQKGV